MKDVAKIVIAILLIILAWTIIKGVFSAGLHRRRGGAADLGRHEAARQRHEADSLMEILAIILALIAAFVVLKFIGGMIKFAVLAAILLVLYLFMTSGFGA